MFIFFCHSYICIVKIQIDDAQYDQTFAVDCIACKIMKTSFKDASNLF